MEYTAEMNLASESGYSMPFDDNGGEVVILRAYGETKDPNTGEEGFHHGVDFATSGQLVAAMADGVVSAVGANEQEHGMYLSIKHKKYEVTYSGLTKIHVNFGMDVEAGHCVAVAGDKLHISVKYDGDELDPMTFISMIYSNAKMWGNRRLEQEPQPTALEGDVPTDYDEEMPTVEKLLITYFFDYLSSLIRGAYQMPMQTGEGLRNVFVVGKQRGYFYETMPSEVNPLGLGQNAQPLLSKAQNLLIGDFLNFLQMARGIVLPERLASIQKKKPMRWQTRHRAQTPSQS